MSTLLTRQLVILVLVAGVLTACVPTPPPPGRQPAASGGPEATACGDAFAVAEQAVRAAGVKDTEAARIPGYPHLRVNRLLASFRAEVHGEGYHFWLRELQALASQGWGVELRNLPPPQGEELQRRVQGVVASQAPTLAILRQCGDQQLQAGLAAERDQGLIDRALVGDNYETWARWLGLYPLTAWAFKIGIDQWHARTQATFHTPLERLPVSGQLLRYAPAPGQEAAEAAQVGAILQRAAANPLGIPLPSAAEQQLLFDRYAPLWEIDVKGDDDRIGYPFLLANNRPRVDTGTPIVFQHLSHTRVGARILLQLNYTIWFPARPKSSPFDLLGGELDGITWRVTLLANGLPWMFDAIHNCGCYHLFFPTHYAGSIGREGGFAENAFQPQPPLVSEEVVRPVVRIAATTHYIERVYATPSRVGRVIPYHLADADELRSLPVPNGQRHSLFGQDGIVVGTERSERYLFWPAGIRAPGAMRQWGHHATAFVGRRHFDDARLFEEQFTILTDPLP